MKIKITPKQLKEIVIKEQYEMSSDSTDVVKFAIDMGLDIKKSEDTENPSKGRKTWDELYPNPTDKQKEQIEFIKKKFKSNYVPEILSSVTYKGKGKFNLTLLDIAKEIEQKSGLDIFITGGNDYFHSDSSSHHSKGNALDFTIGSTGKANDDNNQKHIEKAMIDIIAEGKYGNIGFINEFKKPSKNANAGHMHMSLANPTEISYFEFIDHNGNVWNESQKTPKLTDKYKYEGEELDKKYERVREYKKNLEPIKMKTIDAVEIEPIPQDIKMKKIKVRKDPWELLSREERKKQRKLGYDRKSYEEYRKFLNSQNDGVKIKISESQFKRLLSKKKV